MFTPHVLMLPSSITGQSALTLCGCKGNCWPGDSNDSLFLGLWLQAVCQGLGSALDTQHSIWEYATTFAFYKVIIYHFEILMSVFFCCCRTKSLNSCRLNPLQKQYRQWQKYRRYCQSLIQSVVFVTFPCYNTSAFTIMLLFCWFQHNMYFVKMCHSLVS